MPVGASRLHKPDNIREIIDNGLPTGFNGAPPPSVKEAGDLPIARFFDDSPDKIGDRMDLPHQALWQPLAADYDSQITDYLCNIHHGDAAGPSSGVGVRRAQNHACCKAKIKKNTRASLTVTSLNIRSRSAAAMAGSKWLHMNQLMRDNRIGLLAVQETHLDNEAVANFRQLFGSKLELHWSAPPENHSCAQRVAFVVNKCVTNVVGITLRGIMPGCALLLFMPWHVDRTVNILTVYVPNDHTQNACFWWALNKKWADNSLPIPDVVLGDFNVVKKDIDRLPVHLDPLGVTNAL
ncbi:uncharacterized protein PHACADRAFT_33180 [Phanerochaete carnosa HHB-10118-sp]|uniref:Endonuclease/exonuclease/phosphatase domain-containing protein n=1 Tax=Phanerochaete carnosa (strain HHB-10118-sp) TaxID=650164 RepID=K5VSP2_PHACS|nr:uncharacterized protein PHACADRAFT_33180 [Phanerochaete carnosa HHB-10118-sp]EKM49589.1 hypothetical protein PHACADRAFT_33180 [Phanerochaete carnosa HHB-10118-sp]